MNEQQYKIVKIFTDWPKANLVKVSQAFKIPIAELRLIQSSHNFDSYRKNSNSNKDHNPFDGLGEFGDLFGSMK